MRKALLRLQRQNSTMWTSRVLIPALALLSQVSAQVVSNSKANAAREVTVDVVVTDRAGQPVTGLREADFQVFENSKKQKIRAFRAHVRRQDVERTDVPALPTNTFTNRNSYPPESINVILMDQLNTTLQNQEIARQAVIRYVKSKPPRAAFAIFTLRNDDPACLPFNYAQKLFGVTQSATAGFEPDCLVRGRLMMVHGITADQNLLLTALDGGLARPHATQMREAPFVTFGKPDSYPDGVPEAIDSSISALADIGEFVRELPGRKSLIWMSDSFDAAPIAQSVAVWFPGKFKGWEKTDPFASWPMHHLTADRLAEAEVALYIANLSGKYKDVEVKRGCPPTYDDIGSAMTGSLNSQPGRISRESEEWSCNQHFMKLSYLASQSGGQAFVGSHTVQDVIQQAISDESHYYTLVYSPTKTKFNGRVRHIRIMLSQKDYTLAYRRAYFADDPATLYPSYASLSENVFLSAQRGPLPVKAVRVSSLHPKQNVGSGPSALDAALRYGSPESNNIAFTAHVEPAGQFERANLEEMRDLQENPSFTSERTQSAVSSVEREKQWQRKHRVVFDALPPAEPVSVQPYSVDYSVALNQLEPSSSDSEYPIQLETVIVGYDAMGKRVAGYKQTIEGTLRKAKISDSDFDFEQQVRVPDRVTVLRLVIHDLLSNRIGSLEIPVSSINSPYRRKVLPLPPVSTAVSSD